MIAVDTNLLVYAHREDSPHHHQALKLIDGLASGRSPWAIPWPCIHEFLAIVTHPRIYRPPTRTSVALDAVGELARSPRVHFLSETPDHLDALGGLLRDSGSTGPRVHDARIAAICLSHGIDVLWSADRDFSWFPRLPVVNPLASA